jgi:uncharacterized protein (TIGR02145 family)
MKIELTLTEMMVLIDLIKKEEILTAIKQVVEHEQKPQVDEVQIGEQIWMKEDLKVTHFRNGEPIPLVKNDDEWRELTTAAYCITKKGNYLYNWYAANDSRGLAPEGWGVPTDEEWTKLTDYLGGKSLAGRHMKSSPSDTPTWDGTNSSGFSALPGGSRTGNGYFGNVGSSGFWWSASPSGGNAWYRVLSSDGDYVYRNDLNQRYGFSVRCIKK